MTDIEAHMLASSMAIMASVIATECLDECNDDPNKFQAAVNTRMRKVLYDQLVAWRLIHTPSASRRITQPQDPPSSN